MKLAPTSLLAIAILSLSITETIAGDWPQWRGPNRDAICNEKDLLGEGLPIAEHMGS